MKAVMLSIRPKWVELIASGEKTVEVRKTRPKFEVSFKCYIYCTNDRKETLNMANGQGFGKNGELYLNGNCYYPYTCGTLNGKVVGEFVCDKIYEFLPYTMYDGQATFHYAPSGVKHATCLTGQEFDDYAKGQTVYGWHISNLKIYDKPKELGEFRKYFASSTRKNGKYELAQIARPPQSWCYVEEVQQ